MIVFITMPKPLDVPWKEIREICEKGTPLVDVAKLFNISKDSIRVRSARENWNTPKRVQNKLNKVAGVQSRRVAENAVLAAQLNEGEGGQNHTASSSGVVDFDQATKDYRSKGVVKLAHLLNNTVIAPPRTWKDYDIADKIMRRLLGLDDDSARGNSTVVQLQVVNDRLRPEDIIEGELIEESVHEVSSKETGQSNPTGLQSERLPIS